MILSRGCKYSPRWFYKQFSNFVIPSTEFSWLIVCRISWPIDLSHNIRIAVSVSTESRYLKLFIFFQDPNFFFFFFYFIFRPHFKYSSDKSTKVAWKFTHIFVFSSLISSAMFCSIFWRLICSGQPGYFADCNTRKTNFWTHTQQWSIIVCYL